MEDFYFIQNPEEKKREESVFAILHETCYNFLYMSPIYA